MHRFDERIQVAHDHVGQVFDARPVDTVELADFTLTIKGMRPAHGAAGNRGASAT
jgi:hypothetical protein